MKYSIILLVLFSLLLFSCNKSDEGIEATLEYHGAYAVDGCGYFIILDGETYKPEDESVIPDQFQDNYSTQVLIDYKLNNKEIEYACGFMLQKKDGIEILKIVEK